MNRIDGLEDRARQKIEKRVAGERNRQFALLKEGNSGGYTMRVKSIQHVDLENDAAKSDEVQISSDSEGSDIFEFVSNIKALDSVCSLKTRESISSNCETVHSQFDTTDNTEASFTNPGDIILDNDFFKFKTNPINLHQPQVSVDLPISEKSNSLNEEFLNYWVLSAPSSLENHLPNYAYLLERAIFADEISDITDIIDSWNHNLDNESVTFLSEFMNALAEYHNHAEGHITTYQDEKKKTIDISRGEICRKEDKKETCILFEEKQSPGVLQDDALSNVNSFKSSNADESLKLPLISENAHQENKHFVLNAQQEPTLNDRLSVTKGAVIKIKDIVGDGMQLNIS
jgi:hypothetical protein